MLTEKSLLSLFTIVGLIMISQFEYPGFCGSLSIDTEAMFQSSWLLNCARIDECFQYQLKVFLVQLNLVKE